MDDLKYLQNLELRLLKLMNQRDLINGQVEELRNELQDLVSDDGYMGPHLTMKWQKYRGRTDWKAVVGMMVGGDAEAMDKFAEEYRKTGGRKFVVTTTRRRVNRTTVTRKEENETQSFDRDEDQEYRLEAVKDLVADWYEHRNEAGGIEDQLLVEWWSKQKDSN